MRLLAASIAVALATCPGVARAGSGGKPVSLGLVTPVQMVPEPQGVSGLRFSLVYGNNAFVNGFDLGLVNMTRRGGEGVQWGAFGMVGGNYTGWQGHLIASVTEGTFEGLQTGIYNQANHARGLQFGVVNMANTMEGVQIGVVNIIKKGGMLPIFPIFNFSFK